MTRDLAEKLGVVSRCDPAGMLLEVECGEGAVIDEAFADKVIEVARHWGIEPRDRVGSSFVSTISADALRKRLESEWRSRLATGLVFLLPAMLMHYLKGYLAGATNYVPNGIEAALVGWVIVASCWPILYQMMVSVFSFRMTPDLFQGTLIIVSFVAGVWATVRGEAATTFHITAFAVLSIALQRMVVWKNAARTAGRGHLMLPFSSVLVVLYVASIVVMYLFDFSSGLCMMLAVPAMLGLLAINRLGHPVTWVIPVFLFVALLGVTPVAFGDSVMMTAGRVEGAFGFVVLITISCGVFGMRDPFAAEERKNRTGTDEEYDGVRNRADEDGMVKNGE